MENYQNRDPMLENILSARGNYNSRQPIYKNLTDVSSSMRETQIISYLANQK